MAVPKKRKTSTRGKQGRSHQGINPVNLVNCQKCGEKVITHQACQNCGFYGDKKVIAVETKLDKKLKKEEKKAKEEEKE